MGEKTIYVRNSNAESAPLGSVEELRSLIGLATTKRADQLLAMFNSVMKGRPLLPAPTDEERFGQELEMLLSAMDSEGPERWSAGAWTLSFHPGTYDAERWPDLERLEQFVREHAVRVRDEFPGSYRGTYPREWGIGNDYYGDAWALTRSAQFVYRTAFAENPGAYERH